MIKTKQKQKRRIRRKKHTRKAVFGTPERPRLSVFRSNTNIYAQVIDDVAGKTIAQSSSAGLKQTNGGNCDSAAAVGKDVAAKAIENGVKAVVFDRNGYKYHGQR